MKRFILIILSFFLIFINTPVYAASDVVRKDIKVAASDGFNLTATFTYPKNKKSCPTVVLLHSLGYSSQWWGTLPQDLQSKGYAVLQIDLRGHGKSVYNSKLTKVSWKDMKNVAFQKYPDDVISIINYIKNEDPKHDFFNNWAIVGADIGASTGVIVADKLPNPPKTIVMLSPVVKVKELYIPVHIAQLTNTDFFAVIGANDTSSANSAAYLKCFAQKGFSILTSDSQSAGMLMLKNDLSLSKVITEWISEYLN